MTDSDSRPDIEAGGIGELPELNRAVLDWPTVEALFNDVRTMTQLVEVIAKTGARQRVEDQSLTIDDALTLLRDRAVTGVQLRYQFQNAQWWDTLMWRGEQIQLVRIRHDFDGAAPANTQT